MKILCFIDSLGSGGAQRQLTTLAVGLKKRGHEVRFLVYHDEDHFLPILQAADIPCRLIPSCSYAQRVLTVRRILRQGWQDVVLAFLEAACLYAELAQIPRQRWGLVAGERSASFEMKSETARWIRQLHRFSDAVVSNSHTNRLMLEAEFPFLWRKLATVYNLVDLRVFRPSLPAPASVGNSNVTAIRIVVAAGYHEYKNLMGVARALFLLNRRQTNPQVVVDWFGAVQTDPTPYTHAERFIAENGLCETLRLHPATRDIAGEYSRADAVGLFSFFEGLPNVVCEGLACGKPILLSDVCDAGNLVQDGKNGFLCDPNSPENMANAFERLTALSFEGRRQMGAESRARAEQLFGEETIVEIYEKILIAASRQKPLPSDCTWPEEIPESARRTVAKWAGECRCR